MIDGQQALYASIPQPSSILFDIGGTLLCEHAYDLAPGLAELQPISGEAKLLAELETEINKVHDSNSAEFTLARWLARNRSSFALAGTVADLELAMWRRSVPMSPMPGVVEALSFFADAGLRLACVSNAVFSGPVLEAELAKHGLSKYFRFVLSSADFGMRKPAADIFTHAIDRLGGAPQGAWFIGDSWTNDVEGAARAGIFPLWLSNNEPPESTLEHGQAASWPQIQELASKSGVGGSGASPTGP